MFSFRTTRRSELRFENGHFVMLGLELDPNPVMRAYSIVSPNYADYLEFLSVKVAGGRLTSALQNIQVGDEILLSTKSSGSLVSGHLLPGKNLYLLGTGTGLAPFMGIIRDPHTYDCFDRVILVHGVRTIDELAYRDYISESLPQAEYIGELVREKFLYYPTVTREPYVHNGRITELILSGKLFSDLNIALPTLEEDRFMICGSPSVLKDTTAILKARGFTESRHGHQAHYVVERAFVEQ